MPGKSLDRKAFLASCRGNLALVAEHRELMRDYGMPENLPKQIAGGLNQ
jgi:hypothetical protein